VLGVDVQVRERRLRHGFGLQEERSATVWGDSVEVYDARLTAEMNTATRGAPGRPAAAVAG
ncbi:hypothetical protein, partial [Streptomyces sp. NPDC006333]|uniref:hypothetical protein n=1 Tax=Streptomyces sp. NPDC006333 TaxID=3156753 RepID=UPI0033A96D99